MAQSLTYEQMFKGTKAVLADRQRSIAVAAFNGHVFELGRERRTSMDLARGITQLSIPNYFAVAFGEDPHKNPVNVAALSILPKVTSRSAYGNSTETDVDYSGYRALVEAGKMDRKTAIRAGKAAEWLVATELDLQAAPVQFFTRDTPRLEWVLDQQAHAISSELNDRIIGNVIAIAEMVRDHGYEDFLDYLVDTRTEIDTEVDAFFKQGIKFTPGE